MEIRIVMTEVIQLSGVIPATSRGVRLDMALARMFPIYSRARLQKWIREGCVLIDGKTLRPRDIVMGGECIKLIAELVDENGLEPEAIVLDVVFEDECILVINKPAGLVVHPGAGNYSGTLANALLHYEPKLQSIPRAGIVHRLDKDTSGLLVVAKKLESHANLVEQLKQRTVIKKYICLVHGEVISGGTVDTPVGRHPVDRKRMAAIDNGKAAVTHYRIRKRYKLCTLLDVNIETGRTHQIRVHMAHIQFPIVGDPIYGKKITSIYDKSSIALSTFPRQALHAASLSFTHPSKKAECNFNVAIPDDFCQLVNHLVEKNIESNG